MTGPLADAKESMKAQDTDEPDSPPQVEPGSTDDHEVTLTAIVLEDIAYIEEFLDTEFLARAWNKTAISYYQQVRNNG